MTNYWVSFWSSRENLPHFEYHGPWWISGEDSQDRFSICAAVRASSEEDAESIIGKAFDDGYCVDEWRFINGRPDDWDPFANDRFLRNDWMKWPYPEYNDE